MEIWFYAFLMSVRTYVWYVSFIYVAQIAPHLQLRRETPIFTYKSELHVETISNKHSSTFKGKKKEKKGTVFVFNFTISVQWGCGVVERGGGGETSSR